jgi:hypothetical protein
MAAFALATAWLGYACTADTPPACPLDPGFEWSSDFGLVDHPQSSYLPGSNKVRQPDLSIR